MAKNASPSPWRHVGMGLEYAGAILVLAGLGHYLFDRGQETHWGLVGGATVGFIGATYNLIKKALKANNEQDDSNSPNP